MNDELEVNKKNEPRDELQSSHKEGEGEKRELLEHMKDATYIYGYRFFRDHSAF
ncbi:MAG: hypothetical protein KDK40_03030 [Chlamydiia bacterium]|nr:hypothetical protein [Chlamydiia bacterium]